MNKAELIADIAEKAKVTKADAGRVLDAFIDSVSGALKKGDSVTVVGFGSFVVRSRAAREGRNPRTGETIKVKASKIPAFRAGAPFKKAISAAKASKK